MRIYLITIRKSKILLNNCSDIYWLSEIPKIIKMKFSLNYQICSRSKDKFRNLSFKKYILIIAWILDIVNNKS